MMPKVNQFLFIQVASSDEEEAALEYKSRIADGTEGELLIEVPSCEGSGKYKRLHLGDELSAYFVTADGVKHYFISYVLGFKEEGVRLVRISKPAPDSITKVQRRHFLRVATVLELAVKVSGGIRFVALTDDVGGGGISFMSDNRWPIKSGTELECWLQLPFKNGSIDQVQFKAEVVRVRATETGRVLVMTRFSVISEGERQKIIRYCFERQLALRKQ